MIHRTFNGSLIFTEKKKKHCYNLFFIAIFQANTSGDKKKEVLIGWDFVCVLKQAVYIVNT